MDIRTFERYDLYFSFRFARKVSHRSVPGVSYVVWCNFVELVRSFETEISERADVLAEEGGDTRDTHSDFKDPIDGNTCP